MTTLDMIGQACPIPVVQAKKALTDPACNGVEVLVDNIVAVQNLEKMANGTGYTFAHSEGAGGVYHVTLTKGEGFVATAVAGDTPVVCTPMPAADPAEGVTVLIASAGMGAGSDELGAILIKGFIFSLSELSPPPRAVIFVNGGAKLTTEGANTVPDLKALEAKGTEVLTCGTCANYYEIKDRLAVGGITDMLGITTRLAAAGRLISL